jgi:hypothetical protein
LDPRSAEPARGGTSRGNGRTLPDLERGAQLRLRLQGWGGHEPRCGRRPAARKGTDGVPPETGEAAATTAENLDLGEEELGDAM